MPYKPTYRRWLLTALLAASAPLAGPPVAAQGPRKVALGDWPDMRGPHRDGSSRETGLIDKWAMNGENFLWRVPFGGRSAPVVFGNRVYVQNPSGRGVDLQERVMALDADSGRVVWEYKFSLFQSDVPPHRVGWASPAVDPETGNIYALSGGAQAIALSREGKLLWDRSFGEEWAAFTTHGGRTMSPIVDGDVVIVSAPVSNWGTSANRAHRLVGLDKRTGAVRYVANPGGRPYDTAYAAATIATINGTRLLIAGLGDGGIHAMPVRNSGRALDHDDDWGRWIQGQDTRPLRGGVARRRCSHGCGVLDESGNLTRTRAGYRARARLDGPRGVRVAEHRRRPHQGGQAKNCPPRP